MKSKSRDEIEVPHLTTGSVLDDPGFSASEALEIKVKADIYRELLKYIHEQKLGQRELATLLGVHQPDVSNLLKGKISKFSVGKLIKYAGKLNLSAEVKLTKPKRQGPAAQGRSMKRVSVIA